MSHDIFIYIYIFIYTIIMLAYTCIASYQYHFTLYFINMLFNRSSATSPSGIEGFLKLGVAEFAGGELSPRHHFSTSLDQFLTKLTFYFCTSLLHRSNLLLRSSSVGSGAGRDLVPAGIFATQGRQY